MKLSKSELEYERHCLRADATDQRSGYITAEKLAARLESYAERTGKTDGQRIMQQALADEDRRAQEYIAAGAAIYPTHEAAYFAAHNGVGQSYAIMPAPGGGFVAVKFDRGTAIVVR